MECQGRQYWITIEEEVSGDPPEEIFADTVADFQAVGEDQLLEDYELTKDESISGSRSWVNAAEETNFQELAKEKWSNFQESFASQGGARLKFEEPLCRDGKLIAQVDVEDIEVEASFWKSAMACVVLGANPPFSVFEGFIKRLWGKLGIERISRMNVGHTIVKFRDVATRDMVLESCVVHFDRKPILLRPWSTDFDKMRLVKSVSVWIRLPDLGLQYWDLKSLSALVSTIGKPMMIDKVTKDRSMMKFARVLVDVEISDDTQFINFINERGQLIEQVIEFEWLPNHCSNCKSLGHTFASCKHVQEAVWRPKKKDSGLENGGSSDMSVPSFEARSKDHHNQAAGKGEQMDIMEKQTETVKDASCAFLETKLKGNKIEEMMRTVFLGWNWYSSLIVEGRILLVWKKDIVSLNVIQAIDQLVNCEVKIKGVSQKNYMTFAYGRNSLEERKGLWTQLALLEYSFLHWLVVGDFNAVFEYDDRIGGRPVTELEVEDSHLWRAYAMMSELRLNGSHYTWSNKQMEGTRIFSKLDRIFINELWIDALPYSEARINWDVIFDHCFFLIKIVPVQLSGQIIHKLKRLEPILLQFNKLQVGDVAQQFSIAELNYEQTQLLLQQNPSSPSLQQDEKEVYLDFGCKSRMYESFLRQKSKINWLRFGDDNTAYFHASLKQRRIGNRITSYMNDEGQIIDNYAEVVEHFYNHFKGFLGKSSTAVSRVNQDCFRQGPVLTLEQQLDLI
ncbi:uncharacterized protein LOC133785043 [Humulus lupulus]|uniref:uncharacterized protein LOC133785043 n=1 Tax=Humulus lupulus TaxID=3486 RepID=UPI002B4168C6|nr:uncharacterized protein LOC133785043 [Humulus lupulus]